MEDLPRVVDKDFARVEGEGSLFAYLSLVLVH